MHIVIHAMGMPFDGDTIRERSLGGSESAAYYLARELLALGHRVDVWTGKEGCDGFFDGVRYAWVGHANEHAPCGTRFEQYAVHTPFDVLIVQRHPVAFHKRFGAKVCIWQLHDLALHRSMPVISHGLWQIDAITGVSHWHVEQIKEVYGFKPDHHHAVPNGIDLSLYERWRPMPTDLSETLKITPREFHKTLEALDSSIEFKLLYQSRPERGLENLVRPGGIMEQLKQANVRLYTCGYGNTTAEMAAYYAQLDEWSDTLPNVTKLGTLTKADLAQVQMRCDALFYPSKFEETSCISAMEAMAAGLPILGSKVGALPETCRGAGALLLPLVNGEPDIKRFVGIVEDWAEHPKVLDEMRERQLKAAPRWTWTESAKKLDALIAKLFEKRSSSFARNLRHCIEHSDIVFGEWLINRWAKGQEDAAPIDPIASLSIEEIEKMYAFADDGPKLKAHYEHHQGKYYDEHEEHVVGEDVTSTTRFRGVLQFVAEAANRQPRAPMRVLDYGCAHGHYVVPLAKMLPAAQFTGVDISARAIKAALSWARKEKLGNTAFVVGDQSALNPAFLCERVEGLATGTDGELVAPAYELFDVVIAGEIVEHVRDYVGLLNQLESVLKPGGLLIVTTPAGRWEWTGREAFKTGREHLHHFERADIEEICGDKDVDIVYAPAEPDMSGFPLGSWVWSVRADGEPYRPVNYERKAKQLAPRELVSACLIVKDGEHRIGQSIDRFADFVDEVVVAIDKRSSDATIHAIDTARRRHPWVPIIILDGKAALEDGFAAARNVTLDAMSGDWILWLDVDEDMQTPWGIHRLLRDGCCNGYALGQFHFAIDPPAVIGTDWPCRLFRRDSGARFHGLVHEHPEVRMGDAVPHTYMRPETKFLHSGYVDENTRRARFRRNWPLLQRDMELNPERKLNAFLMLRDIAQSMMFEMQQTQGHVLEGHPERARLGIKLFERVMSFRQIKMLVDCMSYYSLCCEVLQSGFEIDIKFQVAHPQARDLAGTVELKGRVYSREHLRQLLTLVTEESTKHYESQHL